MTKLIRCGCLAVLVLISWRSSAQSIGVDTNNPNVTFIRDPHTYGTKDEVAYVLANFEFSATTSSITTNTLGGNRFVTNNAGCCLEAPAFLPSGSSITGIEVEGCDDSTTAEINAPLIICASPVGGCVVDATMIIQTGVAATPGCAFYRINLSPPLTVNNLANIYWFSFGQAGDTSGAIRLRAGRIYYKLQVSPDPATATFTDVPVGHPFHRFVEALAAAGITGGCGGGNYCPDAPITRGQMAVFLAGALGLHWTP